MSSRCVLTLAIGASITLLAACDQDPARSMKIANRSAPAAATESAAPSPPIDSAPVDAVGAAPSPKRDASLAAESPATPPAQPKATAPGSKAPPTAKASAGASAAPPRAAPQPDGKKTTASEWRAPGCPPPPEGTSGPSTLAVTGPCAFRHHGTFACEANADDFYISMTRKAARGSTLMVYINVEGYKGPGDYKNAQMFIGVHDTKNIYRWSSDKLAITVGPDQAFAVLPTARLDAEPLLVECTGPMNNYQCSGRGTHEQLLASAEVASGTLRCETEAKPK